MKIKQFAAAFVAATAFWGMTADAFAGIDLVNAREGNSWFGSWEVNATNLGFTFDRMKVWVDNTINLTNDGWIVNPSATNPTTTSIFETTNPTVFTNSAFSHGVGWAEVSSNSTTATASGSSVSRQDFELHFTGNLTDGAKLRLLLYSGGWSASNIVGYGVFAYKKTSTTTQFEYGDLSTGVPVPLPTAAWSGLALIAGLGGFIALRRRERAAI